VPEVWEREMIDFENLTSPVLVAELGANHNGSLQIAKRLIDAAFACGWQFVKLQKRTPDLCVPENQKRVLKETPFGKISYLEYRKKLEFGKKEYNYINAYCKAKPIDWSASIWDLPSLEFLCQYDVPFIKIPSALITNLELVIEAARTRIPVIISTGMSTMEEIDSAVDAILAHANKKPVVMHCNSEYPSNPKDLNLLMIPALKERYDCPIGFSDHTFGLEAVPIAICYGAVVIERHITLDQNMWGTDQKSSLEVHGMSMLKKRVEGIYEMLGDGVKKVTEGEKEMRKKLRG
jgi:N-acetylneuraminate synthase